MEGLLAELKTYIALCGFFIFFFAIIGFIIYSLYRHKQIGKRLEQDAVARGWQHETFRYYRNDNHRISGTTSGGLSWQFDLARSRPTTQHAHSHMLWKTQDIRLEGAAVVITPWATGKQLPTGPTSKFTQMMMHPFIRYTTPGITQEQIKFMETIQPVEVGDMAFRERFLVYSTDPYQVDNVFKNGLERVLTEYAAGKNRINIPIIVIWPWGMHMKFEQLTYDFAKLENIIAFGEALADTQRSSQW